MATGPATEPGTDSSPECFRAAREFPLAHREDYVTASRGFAWPQLDEVNWALDWFDALGTEPRPADQTALWIVEEGGAEAQFTFAGLTERSNRVANWLSGLGVRRRDRLIVMLGNQAELWETILAAMKLGAVVIPASTLLTTADLADRVRRGNARHVVVRDHAPDRETALSILQYAREILAPYKRIRRLPFAELPKTISGKIRRVELRSRERDLHSGGDAAPLVYTPTPTSPNSLIQHRASPDHADRVPCC